MSKEIKSVIRLAPHNFLQDMVGALSLVVMLIGALHLPGLF